VSVEHVWAADDAGHVSIPTDGSGGNAVDDRRGGALVGMRRNVQSSRVGVRGAHSA
jgi:hypothetical protein